MAEQPKLKAFKRCVVPCLPIIWSVAINLYLMSEATTPEAKVLAIGIGVAFGIYAGMISARISRSYDDA